MVTDGLMTNEHDQKHSQVAVPNDKDSVTSAVVSTPSAKTYTNSIEEDIQTSNSFNMHKFVTCFKSEPNLSKVLKEKNRSSSPMMHRGRFIARKLLSGVSMINLGLPFAGNSYEKTNKRKYEKESSLNNIHYHDCKPTNSFYNNDQMPPNDQINEKENILSIQLALKKETSLNKAENLSDSIGRDSVSPITKSTHRMPKAMQVIYLAFCCFDKPYTNNHLSKESIMTPRSRKPVIISAMLNMTADNYNKSFLNYSKNCERHFDLENSNQNLYNSPLQKSKSESEIMDALSSPHRDTQLLAPEEALSLKISNSTSEEALSTPFR